MKTILALLFFGVVAGSCLVGAAGKLPAFKVECWVNSPPLTAEMLRGKVVLLDIWETALGANPCLSAQPYSAVRIGCTVFASGTFPAISG